MNTIIPFKIHSTINIKSNDNFEKLFLTFIQALENILNTENNTYKQILINELYVLLKSSDIHKFSESFSKILSIIDVNIPEKLYNNVNNINKLKKYITQSTISNIIEIDDIITIPSKTKNTIEKLISKNIESAINNIVFNEKTEKQTNSIIKKENEKTVQQSKVFYNSYTATEKLFNKSIDTAKTNINENIDNTKKIEKKLNKIKTINFKHVKNPFNSLTAFAKLGKTLGITMFKGISLSSKISKTLVGATIKGTKFAVNFLGNAIASIISFTFFTAFKTFSITGKLLKSFIKWCFSKEGLMITSFIGGYFYGRFKKEITGIVDSIKIQLTNLSIDNIIDDATNKIINAFDENVRNAAIKTTHGIDSIKGFYKNTANVLGNVVSVFGAMTDPYVLDATGYLLAGNIIGQSASAISLYANRHSALGAVNAAANFKNGLPGAGAVALGSTLISLGISSKIYGESVDALTKQGKKQITLLNDFLHDSAKAKAKLQSFNIAVINATGGYTYNFEKDMSAFNKEQISFYRQNLGSTDVWYNFGSEVKHIVETRKNKIDTEFGITEFSLNTFIYVYYIRVGDVVQPIVFDSNNENEIKDIDKNLGYSLESVKANLISISKTKNKEGNTAEADNINNILAFLAKLKGNTTNLYNTANSSLKYELAINDLLLYSYYIYKYLDTTENKNEIIQKIINDPEVYKYFSNSIALQHNACIRIVSNKITNIDEQRLQQNSTRTEQVLNTKETVTQASGMFGDEVIKETRKYIKHIPITGSALDVSQTVYTPVINKSQSIFNSDIISQLSNSLVDTDKHKYNLLISFSNIISILLKDLDVIDKYQLSDDDNLDRYLLINNNRTPNVLGIALTIISIGSSNLRDIKDYFDENAKDLSLFDNNHFTALIQISNNLININKQTPPPTWKFKKDKARTYLSKYYEILNKIHKHFCEQLLNTDNDDKFRKYFSKHNDDLTKQLNDFFEKINDASINAHDILNGEINTAYVRHRNAPHDPNITPFTDVMNHSTYAMPLYIPNGKDNTPDTFLKELANIVHSKISSSFRQQFKNSNIFLGANVFFSSKLSSKTNQEFPVQFHNHVDASCDIFLNADEIHNILAKHNRSYNITDLNISIPYNTIPSTKYDKVIEKILDNNVNSYSHLSDKNISDCINNIQNTIIRVFDNNKDTLSPLNKILKQQVLQTAQRYERDSIHGSYQTNKLNVMCEGSGPDLYFARFTDYRFGGLATNNTIDYGLGQYPKIKNWWNLLNFEQKKAFDYLTSIGALDKYFLTSRIDKIHFNIYIGYPNNKDSYSETGNEFRASPYILDDRAGVYLCTYTYSNTITPIRDKALFNDYKPDTKLNSKINIKTNLKNYTHDDTYVQYIHLLIGKKPIYYSITLIPEAIHFLVSNQSMYFKDGTKIEYANNKNVYALLKIIVYYLLFGPSLGSNWHYFNYLKVEEGEYKNRILAIFELLNQNNSVDSISNAVSLHVNAVNNLDLLSKNLIVDNANNASVINNLVTDELKKSYAAHGDRSLEKLHSYVFKDKFEDTFKYKIRPPIAKYLQPNATVDFSTDNKKLFKNTPFLIHKAFQNILHTESHNDETYKGSTSFINKLLDKMPLPALLDILNNTGDTKLKTLISGHSLLIFLHWLRNRGKNTYAGTKEEYKFYKTDYFKGNIPLFAYLPNIVYDNITGNSGSENGKFLVKLFSAFELDKDLSYFEADNIHNDNEFDKKLEDIITTLQTNIQDLLDDTCSVNKFTLMVDEIINESGQVRKHIGTLELKDNEIKIPVQNVIAKILEAVESKTKGYNTIDAIKLFLPEYAISVNDKGLMSLNKEDKILDNFVDNIANYNGITSKDDKAALRDKLSNLSGYMLNDTGMYKKLLDLSTSPENEQLTLTTDDMTNINDKISRSSSFGESFALLLLNMTTNIPKHE